MAIRMWDQVPGNSQLVVTVTKKDGSPGTFAVSGWKNDSDGNFQQIPSNQIVPGPFTFTLRAGKVYQFAFEVAPAGGAEVIVEAKAEKNGKVVRPAPKWGTIKDSPASRGLIIRMKKN